MAKPESSHAFLTRLACSYFYTRIVPAPKRVFLDLRTPRTGKQTAAAMVQVFNALPTPPSGLLKHWQGVPTFYFEIVSVEQTTHFQVVTPRAYREYLISQLMAVYPEMVILEGSECMFPAPAPLTITQLTRLQLARPNYYPLLSLEAFAADGGDGLSGALSALSQLREGEAALLQLAVSKAHESWKDATLRQLAASHEAPPLNDNFQVLVRHKLGLPSFRFTLHLVVQATDEQRAYDLERQLRESLHIFASPVNYLERSRLWWPHRQLARVLQRQVAPRRQILSSEELAMVYHLPNRSLSTIRNLAWGKRLPGEPPENLPAYAATDPAERKTLNVMAQVEFKNKPHTFGLRREDRRRHLYVVGKTCF